MYGPPCEPGAPPIENTNLRPWPPKLDIGIQHDHLYPHSSHQALKRKYEDISVENQQLKQKLKVVNQSLKRCRYTLNSVLVRLKQAELLSEELQDRLAEYEGKRKLIYVDLQRSF